MADKIFENNQVSIMGEIVSDFRFSHEVYGEGFYMVDVAVNRLSNYLDYIPLMISERLIDVNADYIGQIIYVNGQFRSFNRHEEKKNRLVLSVFVRELEFLEELQEDMKKRDIEYQRSQNDLKKKHNDEIDEYQRKIDEMNMEMEKLRRNQL